MWLLHSGPAFCVRWLRYLDNVSQITLPRNAIRTRDWGINVILSAIWDGDFMVRSSQLRPTQMYCDFRLCSRPESD